MELHYQWRSDENPHSERLIQKNTAFFAKSRRRAASHGESSAGWGWLEADCFVYKPRIMETPEPLVGGDCGAALIVLHGARSFIAKMRGAIETRGAGGASSQAMRLSLCGTRRGDT
jgi:hypothetical protein